MDSRLVAPGILPPATLVHPCTSRGNDDCEINQRFLRVPDASCAPLTYIPVGNNSLTYGAHGAPYTI
jgi:hypothetical protein